mgnify:CR=1 FL=1
MIEIDLNNKRLLTLLITIIVLIILLQSYLKIINKYRNDRIFALEAEKYAIEALEAVKIPAARERLQAYPHELSGGMRQRVIIAMALASNAELIIADEPTTALDVTIQKQIMALLDELRKEFNTSVLLISHDLALVSNYADEISVMYSGHVVEEASGKEFFKNTIHPYSVALLNSLPQKNPYLKLVHQF